MNNQQILEKAIQKAIAGGWSIMGKFEANKIDVVEDVFSGNYMIGFLQNDNTKEILTNTKHYTEVIFNHDFAKALWGEERVVFTQRDFKEGKTLGDNALPKYQYHLQQLVIAEDVFKYLEANI